MSGLPSISQQEFPHLQNAPITEAVLEMRGTSDVDWTDPAIKTQLTEAFPDSKIDELRSIKRRFDHHIHDEQGVIGLLVAARDGKEMVRFAKNTFLFSRLSPYLGWPVFEHSALKAWDIHKRLVGPVEISQIGVRFINQIPLAHLAEVQDYLAEPPRPHHHGWISTGFVHQDRFTSPDLSYGISITKTIQPRGADGQDVLILDIDVASFDPWVGSLEILKSRLDFMRNIKNKAFFEILSTEAIRRFK